MRGSFLLLAFLVNAVCVLSGKVYKVVNADALNVRSGPGTNYGIVGTLKLNDVIYVLSTSKGWAKFYKGYVSTDYLKAGTNPLKYETTTDLNFREGPSPDYSALTTLKQGKAVNYYGRDPSTTSWAVTDKGYANASYLTEKATGSSSGSKSAKLKKAEAAADYARNHAEPKSTGWCARYVANALENAGFSFTRQASACQYHTNGTLKGMGFVLQSSRPNPLKKGDIAVHGCNSSHVDGHIQIYDGNKWYSDFVQNTENIMSTNVPPIYYYRIPK